MDEISESNLNAEENLDGNNFLNKVLDEKEYGLLPVSVVEKIENSVQQSFEEFLTNKALYETSKFQYEEEIKKFKNEIKEKEKTLEEVIAKLDLVNSEKDEIQERFNTLEESTKKLQEQNKQLQKEWQDFKIQRDQAVDERESLLQMVERRNSEITSLKIDLGDTKKQLQSAIKAKMVALEKAEEVESLKISLSYKEKRLEQESSILNNQIQSLTEELNKQTTELSRLKRENSTKFVSLEAEISAKTQELKIAQTTIADLREANEKLTQKVESLLEKSIEQRNSTDQMFDSFQQELQAQTKLTQLYKGLCEENDSKTEKLTSAINELQQLLKNASDQYGELETGQKVLILQHEEEISQKNECIRLLKKELEDANELLKLAKEENLETAIATLSPCAAAAGRLIKSGMSLTQIYTQYASVSEQLLLEKEENRKLSLYVNTILNEIEEKAPILKQQRIDYENALSSLNTLTKQMDDLVAESKILQEQCSDTKKNNGFLKRDNERLKKEVADLSRQVCYLIKAVEEARGGFVSDFNGSQISYDETESSAQHIISKKLVTFGSIQDLQENNQKLLALVRQLSAKQEAAEKVSSSEFYDLKIKEEKLQARVNELMEDMERQSKMLDLIKNQSLTYKKLYDQSIRGETPQNTEPPGSPMKGGVVTSTPKKKSPSKEEKSKLDELKAKLDESEKEKKALENEKNTCKAEIAKLEKQSEEQIQSLKKEINDLIYKNSKLVAQAEFYEEKCKVMESNIKTCKKQIEALEERNKMLGEISAKHEQSTVHLRNEVIQLQSSLSKAEVSLDNLRQENFLLKAAEARLLKENECYSREKHSHLLLMSNLDAIKATFERSEEEGKLRLEAQLSDTMKECTALKSALKEEKTRFKELAASLERQTNVAKERMQEEKELADKARGDLEKLREELESKNKKIEELLNKIRELNNMPTKSVIESVSINLDESTKRNKELEKKIVDLKHEISCLELQLSAAKQHRTQYCEMAESLEKQLNEANENHENFRGLMTAKVDESTRRENEWKKKYQNLEEKYQMISNNQKNSAEELNAKLATSSTELKTTNTELVNLKTQLCLTENELKKAKDTINSLHKSLQEAEVKYSNEVVLHSADIQSLTSVKNELSETVQQIAKLKTERDNAVESLKLMSSTCEEKEKKAVEELKQLNQRLVALDEQNRVLHEHIQELGNQVAILQCRVADDGHKPIEESSLNESTELSSKAQDQLLKVIKFLRQEKDVALTKSEVLQAENVRLKTQIAILTKQLEEAKETLKNSQESSEASLKASAKHAELLRKIDTLNAITDSNRILREERDNLQCQLKQVKEDLEKSKEALAPLTAEIKKLNDKVETMTTENQALLIDLAKWKHRAERSNKGTPEDWRRLTNERENLAKQWQLEKNNNEKLEDELKKVKQEKTSLNEQIVHIQKSLVNETNEIRRLTEECNSYKQQLIKSSETLNSTKNQLTKVIEESTKQLKEVEAKEAVIKDFKTKEEKLRRLCNKYKKQYELLLKSVEDEKKEREEEIKKGKDENNSKSMLPEEEKEKFREEGRTEVKNELMAKLSEMETKFTEKIKELEANVCSAQEESENLKKDNENLKTSINEKEERVKTIMKNARTKIAQLSEQKKNLEMEIKEIKEETEMSKDESDSKLSNLKAHYESKISEMEKERTGHVAERDQERDRLNNQIKALNQKINQMQRLFEKQLGAKPSTSSRPPDKSPMEPPTANIKPMAGSSSSPRKEKQTTGPVGPCWRSGNETPFASIRPTISMQARTLAVLPTSQTNNNQTPSSQSTPVMVLPQQQVVHTTGSSGEAMSSSPTSSHTDYMPATSSATPTRQVVVAPPLSVGPPTGSDAQSTQEMEAEAHENEMQQQSSSQQPQSLIQQQQTQTVALVMPRERVEQQTTTTATTQSNQQQSIDQSCGIAYSQANSSNTVTTTQAGLKRTRDVEGDSSTGLEGEDLSKVLPQGKRARISVTGNQAEVFHHQITHSEGIEVEYQVPTSSQKDQEDDNLIMIDSDEEGNADEGDVEGGEDEHEFEEDNSGYEVGSYSRNSQEMGLTTYDEGPDIDEENVTDQDNNEVEVVDDGSEVPNQSGSSRNEIASDATQSSNNVAVPVASSIESESQNQALQQSSEATSSGPVNNENENNIVIVSHAASSQSSQNFRNRSVPLLNRQPQSQLILPQNYEESGDDGIVPSTPTLFIPRRTDGFGEAVSSPQIPHQGRFTFSDPSAPITRSGLIPATGEGSEDSIHLEEPGTGRSVPTTPLQVSPQELPTGEVVNEVGQSSSSAHVEGEESDVALNIPDIVVTITEDDDRCDTPPPELSESAGEEEEPAEKDDTSEEEPEVINLEEENDGVTSEGEKPQSALGEIEEGREAEASEPFDSGSMKKPITRIGGNIRRSMRVVLPRKSQTRRLTPIVWNEPGSSSGSTSAVGSVIPPMFRGNMPGERILSPEQPRTVFRGRMQRARKWR